MTHTNRLNHFVQGHRRLILFLSASIALATFIVKDGIRQDLKDLVDSIDAAEQVFMIRSDDREVMVQLGHVEQFLTQKNARWEGLRSSQSYYRSLTAELDGSLALLAKVPHGEEYDKKAIALITKRSEWMSNPLRPLTPIPERPIPRDKSAEAAEKMIEKKLWADAYLLDYEVGTFGASVIDMARTVKAQEEHRYRVSKCVSYILYALSWLLGLLGTMFGVQASAEPG